VLHRALVEWGYACDVIAPSLIPKRPGVQRKHDKRDAADLARLYRAGELTGVRIPSEAEERVRDVVRCETFQREILKSRRYLLKFLARGGFVFREGTNWCTPHLKWLQHLTTEGSPLSPPDRLVYREYRALLMYKLERRDELDREIAVLAELPTLAPIVRRLQCFRGISLHSAMVLGTEIVDWRRFEHPQATRLLFGPRLARRLERRPHATRLDHEGREQSLPPCARAGGLELSASAADERRSQTAAARQLPAVITHAWKAQQRLHKRFTHLAYRKESRIPVVAVARELVGFLWAVMRDVPPQSAAA
jgi:transposase